MKPLRLIEPFGVGGGPDLLARAIARPLSERLRRPIEVVNHPGGGSTAAPALVATAAGDGRTLLVNTSAHAYSAAAARDLPYDPLSDFVAVAPLTSQAYVVVAGRSAGFNTLSGLVAAARARPRALRFGSTGVGTATHIGTVELNRAAGISTTHVPAGPGDAISDVVANVVAGAIDFAMAPISAAAPHLADGGLVAIGVTTCRRSPALPDVPAVAEGGLTGYDFPIWYGLWAPASTSSEITGQLADDIALVISELNARGWLDDHGMSPMSMRPQEFAAFVVYETRRAARILQASAAATA